ncbi:hypothetical protein CXG81DRAFT_23105 [Caulochytrium protostelioides]|uniref:Uncharacterized protein n=1 Tax=Caulochytrium protostelioides TaxID=1555241 RepID=A0A4P9WWG2_9FUNG|nr:hypothetical protein CAUPRSCDRAFT_11436 [Caulochytrium protostelioides]RKP04330.1 hypothetical protein CXG81DRAFT_23105 [Caulochytrium protostelioides]|eukprot:RKP04330.1 hypothetical protein CXG81DRAFT_23105 [Caulochytrium protostelioides]
MRLLAGLAVAAAAVLMPRALAGSINVTCTNDNKTAVECPSGHLYTHPEDGLTALTLLVTYRPDDTNTRLSLLTFSYGIKTDAADAPTVGSNPPVSASDDASLAKTWYHLQVTPVSPSMPVPFYWNPGQQVDPALLAAALSGRSSTDIDIATTFSFTEQRISDLIVTGAALVAGPSARLSTAADDAGGSSDGTHSTSGGGTASSSTGSTNSTVLGGNSSGARPRGQGYGPVAAAAGAAVLATASYVASWFL